MARLTGVLRPMLETRLPADVTAQGGWVPCDCDHIQFAYDRRIRITGHTRC